MASFPLPVGDFRNGEVCDISITGVDVDVSGGSSVDSETGETQDYSAEDDSLAKDFFEITEAIANIMPLRSRYGGTLTDKLLALIVERVHQRGELTLEENVEPERLETVCHISMFEAYREFDLLLDDELKERVPDSDSTPPDAQSVLIGLNTSGNKIKRHPSENAIKAYQAITLAGKTQNVVAQMMGKNQGTISRYKTDVEKWLEDGGVIPQAILSAAHQPSRSVLFDTNVVEMGRREDGRTPRQRDSRREDEGE